jgi:hypothetical protein
MRKAWAPPPPGVTEGPAPPTIRCAVGVTLQRMDLHEADGRRKPVLCVLLEGQTCTDPGSVDCFVSPMAAAEAAWRLAGRPANAVARWLETAHAALELPASGVLLASDFHPPRILGSAALADGSVRWLAGAGGGQGPSKAPGAPPAPPSAPPAIEPRRPTSSPRAPSPWATSPPLPSGPSRPPIEAAPRGAPDPAPRRPLPGPPPGPHPRSAAPVTTSPEPGFEPLSGLDSGDWAFVDAAGGGTHPGPSQGTQLGPRSGFLNDTDPDDP